MKFTATPTERTGAQDLGPGPPGRMPGGLGAPTPRLFPPFPLFLPLTSLSLSLSLLPCSACSPLYPPFIILALLRMMFLSFSLLLWVRGPSCCHLDIKFGNASLVHSVLRVRFLMTFPHDFTTVYQLAHNSLVRCSLSNVTLDIML